MLGSIIGGVLAAGASVAAIHQKRVNRQKQLKYDAELREYNSPKEQMKRFLDAGINPYGQQYQNVVDANFDESMFDDGTETQNVGGSLGNIYNNMLAARAAEDQHDLAEQQKKIGEETLFSAKVLNDWLNDQEKAKTEGLQEDAKGKKIDNAFRGAEHNLNIQSLGEDIRNKQTYNKYYGQLLQKELNLKDEQVKQFEQQYEINKNLVLVNQERYAQMIADPKRLYRMVDNQLKYEEKSSFYLLEAHRIQHMLDTMSEKLLPETEQAMRAQLTYALTHADFSTNEDKFNDHAWMRWMNYGFDKVEQLGNVLGGFGRLGVYKNLMSSKRWGNQDYTRSYSDGNGEYRGGYTQTYQNIATR